MATLIGIMTEEWCCEKLEKLKIKENRLTTLTEIRVRLNESASLETMIANRLLSAPELYDCLEEPEVVAGTSAESCTEQVNLANDILSICMANLSISPNELPSILQRALKHQQPRIRSLALNTILKELRRQRSATEEHLIVSDDLLMLVMEALQQDETEVAVPSISILSLVLEERLELAAVRETLLQTLSKDETVKCRVFELAVNLAKRSPRTLQQVEFLLDRALSELDNDDILVQVNVLEILVSLTEQNHGMLYLEKRQVFEIVSKRVEGLEQNPLDRLLVPGIMKFFGKVACLQPLKIITGYPQMIQCLFECLHTGDISILPAAFDTFANLAQSQQGKILLEKHYSGVLKEIFEDYASHLRNLSSELKNRAFSTLEVIFTAPPPDSPEISEILRKWFTYLAAGTNMQFLLDFCRNPFPDIKVACLSFIRAVCQFTWGLVALKDTAGFLEYLLDRKIEFDKEAKYAKHEVIKLLANSNVFDVQTHIQLRLYMNQGPFYVETAMEIAVEGAN